MGARHRARAHAIQVNYYLFLKIMCCPTFNFICWTFNHTPIFRSSGAKLFQLASAEGHWSPRCTTARSNSLCHAGSQSRVVPSSRPTGPTPTLSRRAAPAQSHAASWCPCHAIKAGKAAVVANWQQSRLILLVSEKWGRCLAEMAKQLIQLIIAGGQVLNLSWQMHTFAHNALTCRWWEKHLARQWGRRSDWARRRLRLEAIAAKTPLSKQRLPGTGGFWS